METKDVFFTIGICSTLIFSLFTLLLGFKNRRSPLREHLYKEQITFFSRFLTNTNKLNLEIDSLVNNSSKRKENSFHELLETVGVEYYNSEFLVPSKISGQINELIFKGNKFYLAFLSTNSKEIEKEYIDYYTGYSEMLNSIKRFVGTNELSSENESLHSQKQLISNEKLRNLISGFSEGIIAGVVK